MFHCLARTCADLLIGGPGSTKSKHAWVEVYRSLSHGAAKSACEDKKIISKFPSEIADFANKFVEMQQKRHDADYDPYAKLYKSDVIADIDVVDIVIKGLLAAPTKDRRALASWVLFRNAKKK